MATLKTQGTELYILDDADTGNEVQKLGQVTSFNINDSDDPQIDTTNFDSTRREFLSGLPGEISSSIGFDFDPQSAAWQKLQTARNDGTTLRIFVAGSESTTQPTFSAGFTLPTDRTTWDIAAARITSFNNEAAQDDVWRGTTSLGFSAVTITPAA